MRLRAPTRTQARDPGRAVGSDRAHQTARAGRGSEARNRATTNSGVAHNIVETMSGCQQSAEARELAEGGPGKRPPKIKTGAKRSDDSGEQDGPSEPTGGAPEMEEECQNLVLARRPG